MLPCPRCGHPNGEHARFCSACGALLEDRPSASDPLIGLLIADRYRIVRPLGEGGMGRVYLAEQRMGTTIRAVAVKVLSTPMSDTLAVARFYRECETVVQLSHPHTIRFYDFGEVVIPMPGGPPDRRLYIAMEYVEGRSLAKAIAEGPMPFDVVDRLVRQIGGALTEAHRRGIVHRDLKPDNVLLARNEAEGEIAKVLDFGIAKRGHEEGPEITAQGTIVGTPAYMSPEQITGMPIDERSDVYALALITYEMLTGSRPFVARTPIEWASAHTTAAPRPFDDFPATRRLPLEKRVAVLRGLEKDPSRRTPSVRRFVEELCGGEPSQLTPIPPTGSDASSRAELGSAPTVSATPRARGVPSGALEQGDDAPAGIRSLGSMLAMVIGGAALIVAGAGSAWLLAGQPDLFALAGDGDAGVPSDAEIDDADAEIDAAPPEPTLEWFSILHFEELATDATLALGEPDGRCARIRPNGTITLEITPGEPVTTDGGELPDLYVEILEGSQAYRVDVAPELRQFTTVAQGLVGSTPLDVDQFEIARIRYVKVKNRATRGEVCVDAVAVYRRPL